jgi:hypothetical protein
MRKIVSLNNPDNEIKRLMLYTNNNETYLFWFKTLCDSSSDWDEWYEWEIDAIERCIKDFKINPSDWEIIPDPYEDCQDDWINPVRLKSNKDGIKISWKFEKLINGKWIDFE